MKTDAKQTRYHDNNSYTAMTFLVFSSISIKEILENPSVIERRFCIKIQT